MKELRRASGARAQERPATKRGGTATAQFGVSKRESHDASAFYERFDRPAVSQDETVVRAPERVMDQLFRGDSRSMRQLPDNCVALVVTSPPYFSGKEYEADLSAADTPSSYEDYHTMLRDVFRECYRVLEPGGRIAVNVANLGRRPYRSLSSDIVHLFAEVGFLLRGEIVWIKGEGTAEEGAGGNCAWGSYRSAVNPVLRDVTESIIVASKARFDRALTSTRRRQMGLPWQSTISGQAFLDWTLDTWYMAAVSAKRVGHPAPFPIELPQRLIQIYTFRDDLVLDPFMGSGQTALACVDAGRRFVGYDTDGSYVTLANKRIAEYRDERTRRLTHTDASGTYLRDATSIDDAPTSPLGSNFQATSTRQAHAFAKECDQLLQGRGYTITVSKKQIGVLGIEISREAVSPNGRTLWFAYHGSLRGARPGLRRTDTVKKALADGTLLSTLPAADRKPFVILTSHLPKQGSAKKMIDKAVDEGYFASVLCIYDPADEAQLADL